MFGGSDVCSEICGDGIRLDNGRVQCDDANVESGDGCDSNCNIESGWTCSGGSSSSRDMCTETCGKG